MRATRVMPLDEALQDSLDEAMVKAAAACQDPVPGRQFGPGCWATGLTHRGVDAVWSAAGVGERAVFAGAVGAHGV